MGKSKNTKMCLHCDKRIEYQNYISGKQPIDTDGLSLSEKEEMKVPSDQDPEIPHHKKCVGECHEWLPDTSEYFAKSPHGGGQLQAMCKKCRGKRSSEAKQRNKEKKNGEVVVKKPEKKEQETPSTIDFLFKDHLDLLKWFKEDAEKNFRTPKLHLLWAINNLKSAKESSSSGGMNN